MKDKVLEILAAYSGRETEELSDETRLVADLGLSSFDMAGIAVQAEEELGLHIPDERFPEFETVGDVIRIMEEVK